MCKIRIMEEISINGFDVSTVCRLCLSRDVTTLNIFAFSTRLMNQVADVIMKCAPVQITSCDEMPNLICNSCSTQLEKSYQFQKQIVQSDQTLRRYLQQLRTSNKQIKVECSNQGPSDDSLIHNTNITTKSESLELQDVSDNNVNLKEEVPPNYTSTYAISEKIFIKSEIKEEPIDYESFTPTECTDILIDSLSKGDDRTTIEEQSDNITGLPHADLPKQFDNREGGNKNSSGSHKKNAESDKRIYKCDLCNKYFAFLNRFNIHKREHTREKPYQSSVCEERFSEPGTLIKHQRVHPSEKPYQCDVCNKCFRKSSNLKIHQRLHTGEKPYRCGFCNKSFNQPIHLTKHQRVHTGEKPYQCDVCNKCFRESCNLITHQLKHFVEPSYQCRVCDKYFSEAGALIRHQREHTG